MIVRYSQMWDEDREEWVHRYEALAHKQNRQTKHASNGKPRYRIITAILTRKDDKLAAQFIRDQLRALRRLEANIDPLPLPDSRFQNIEI